MKENTTPRNGAGASLDRPPRVGAQNTFVCTAGTVAT
jgi:hypothetical protein